MKRDDRHIIKEVLNGKSREFEHILNKYSQQVFNLVVNIVSSKEDAEELTQDVFLKAFQSLSLFKEESSFSTWLYRIATNETYTFVSKNSHVQYDDIDEAATAIEADEWFDGDHLQARLQAAIQSLPPKQRMVFNMKYYDEMKYEEMSAILGTSTGALKASYHIAVKKISEYLERDN